ncbi:MAG: glutamate--tRNA ligase, partial [Bacteroidia bacterium]|nr:glutamate--tRNA ligase [Bacteroidia bacterium]
DPSFFETQGIRLGKVMPALRLAITGTGGGPDLASIMEIIDKENSLLRMEKALNQL